MGAPPKEIRLAETRTTLKGETDEQAVRTIVCREIVPGPKKDRWHPLYTTSQAEPWDVLEAFRTRQHHEQGYRVGVHDEFLNAVPCGYDKDSPNRKRPRFHRGPLQMIGWLAGLVYNAIADLTDKLPDCFHGAACLHFASDLLQQTRATLYDAGRPDRPTSTPSTNRRTSFP